MADFQEGVDGVLDDRVRLVFNGSDTYVFESYTVRCSILQQPAIFSIKLGPREWAQRGDQTTTLAGMMRAYPPNTPFQLFIGQYPQFTGYTDGYEGEYDGNGSGITLMGRDVLARLHDADVEADQTFKSMTYVQLVRYALAEVGLGDRILIADNEANTEIRAGVGVTHTPGASSASSSSSAGGSSTGDASTIGKAADRGAAGGAASAVVGLEPVVRDILAGAGRGAATDVFSGGAALEGGFRGAAGDAPNVGGSGAGGGGGGTGGYTITAKMGERWLEFLQKHLEKAGLFLWSDFEGNIVLSTPNGEQDATYHFVRQLGQAQNQGKILGGRIVNNTTKRFAYVQIFARGNGKKLGRGKLNGAFIDDEMVAYGYKRARTFRDANCLSELQAQKYARHKIGEANRASWNVTYTMRGHWAFTPDGGRAVLAPDTVAQVDDEELGISGELYIETVEFRGGAATTTTVTMMRPGDLTFEKDPDVVAEIEKQGKARPVRKARKRGRKKR